MRKFLLAALAMFLLWPSGAALAQQWPSKPIKLVLSFGPGSASDALARIAAQELMTLLGQPVVLIHKPGADGSISGTEVQRSAPDGYTFLFATNSALSVAPNMRKVPPYNVLTDFTPITFMGLNTIFFVVHPSVPATTLAELVAHAKANPGKLNAASGNTFAIVGNALFSKHNGITMETIPYKSEPEAIIDLLTGRVQLIMATSTSTLGHVKDGKLRILSTALPERSPLQPDVPSLIEAGQPKFPFDPWFALVGPAGLPPEIVGAMNKVMATVLAKPEVKEQMNRQGFIPRSSSPEWAASYIKDQFAIWKKAMEDAGIEPQ